jgi:hypothetical protein
MAKEITIDLLDLPSDWLDQYREERLAKRRKAIRLKHRRRHLRQLRRRPAKGETYGQEA